MNIQRKLHNLLHPKMGEVWMLHRVVVDRSEKPEQRVLEVTTGWLEDLIKERQQLGFHFVGLDEIDSSRHWVCITLDDGYRDNFTNAYPIFKRLNVPFAVFVTTGFVDNQREMWWYPGEQLGIGTEELREMATDPLCTIGAHTLSHPKLETLSQDEQHREIQQSKQWLESVLSKPVNHFSYPHGAYNDASVNICRDLGFHTALTTNGRTVRSDYDPLQLDRINVTQP